MIGGLTEEFIKIYSNIPLGVRKEIILVLEDGRPISWDVAFIEVHAHTPLSEIILKDLRKLNII